MSRDLTSILKKMHSLHIIHGDISTDNVMYSPSLKKFVFIDFGLSRILKEEKGEKTETFFFGKINFS